MKNKSFLVFMIISFFWFVIISKSIISVLPTNPMSPSVDEQNLFKTIYPQGWGFFSKNPREEMINVYEMESFKQAVSWPNNNIKNFFGLYRFGRAQGIELGYLIDQIPPSIKWITCNEALSTCFGKISTKLKLNNDFSYATLCGSLGLTKETVLPWAWGKPGESNISKETKVLRVEVECS